MAGFENISSDELLKLHDKCTPENLNLQICEYNGFILTERFKLFQYMLENFEVYDDDIWLTSCPKSGTTWTQEMIWSILNNIHSEEARISIEKRFPFLEYCILYNFADPDMTFVDKSIEYARDMPRPRLIKTHLPWDLLPVQIRNFEKRPKIIHVSRNPKDAAVSFYHHSKIFRGYQGHPNIFYQLFLRDLVRFGPFMKIVESYWIRRHDPNVLFLRFEDMKADLKLVIKRTAAFLQVSLNDAKTTELLKRLSLEEMKKNTDVSLVVLYLRKNELTPDKEGTFLRKGATGSHIEEMDEKTQELFDEWMKKSKYFQEGIFV